MLSEDYAAIEGLICDRFVSNLTTDMPIMTGTRVLPCLDHLAYLTDFLDQGYFEYRFDSSKEYDESTSGETYQFRLLMSCGLCRRIHIRVHIPATPTL